MLEVLKILLQMISKDQSLYRMIKHAENDFQLGTSKAEGTIKAVVQVDRRCSRWKRGHCRIERQSLHKASSIYGPEDKAMDLMLSQWSPGLCQPLNEICPLG